MARHFVLDLLLLWIEGQFFNHAVQDVLDPDPLVLLPTSRLPSLSVGPEEVLVHRLEPADVVVGVGDEVDVDHPGLRGMARLIPAFLG